MTSLIMGLLSVAGLVIALFHPPAGAMVLTVAGCWFMWERG
jgi:hypothetical protein